MNVNQFHLARLARWSQNGDARLTPESAAEWLKLTGMCLWLPGGSRTAAPAPSFLEAVVGRPAPVPSAGEIARAGNLLTWMIENAAAAPLKFSVQSGDGLERIASPEALRYIYALRGDRNFKNGPSTTGNTSVTPLALHCFEAIREQGPLTALELRTSLAGDITETALARALNELWLGLYAFPIWTGDSQNAKWESFSRGFPGPIAAGACTSHMEAQSALISLYLHAVVAAAEEDILEFLGPLAPQSKLREVIRDLGSMRQLEMVDIGGRVHLCLPGEELPGDAVHAFKESLATGPDARENAAPENLTAPQKPLYAGRSPSRGTERVETKRFGQRKVAAGNVRSPKFPPKQFQQRKSGKPSGAMGSPHSEFSGGSGGGRKPWIKGDSRPWKKKEFHPSPSWRPGRDRSDEPRRGEGSGTSRDFGSRDGEKRRRENWRGKDTHSADGEQGRDRRRWNRPDRPWRASGGETDGTRPAEGRPWARKSQQPRSGGPRPKKAFAGRPEKDGDIRDKQPFWMGKPRRGKGSAGKSGGRHGQGGPRGKKK